MKKMHAVFAASRVLTEIFEGIERGEQLKTSARLCDAECEREGLSGAHSARVFDVTLGVLRYRENLDSAIKTNLSKGKLDFSPLELNLLRAAAYELYIRRADEPAGLVSELVEIAKQVSAQTKNAGFPGLVNAVARKLATMPNPVPPGENAPLAEFAAYYSIPIWILEKMSAQRGENWAKAAAAATGDRIVHQLRVNPFREPNEALPLTLGARSLESECEGAWEVDSLTKSVRDANDGGLVVVQTLPSQIAAVTLDPRPGDTVLDAASGVGVKAGHLCALTSGWGDIVFCDKLKEKRTACVENFARWNIPMPEYKLFDLSDADASRKALQGYGGFDAILLDAPCTGSGLLNHMPEKRYTLSESEAAKFGEMQVKMLSNCLGFLKPEGSLVYATCSVWREENEDVVEAALAGAGGSFEPAEKRLFAPSGRYPGFYIEKIVKLA